MQGIEVAFQLFLQDNLAGNIDQADASGISRSIDMDEGVRYGIGVNADASRRALDASDVGIGIAPVLVYFPQPVIVGPGIQMGIRVLVAMCAGAVACSGDGVEGGEMDAVGTLFDDKPG